MAKVKRSKGRPRIHPSGWGVASIVYPKDVLAQVRREAKKRGMTLSEYVRRITVEALTREE